MFRLSRRELLAGTSALALDRLLPKTRPVRFGVIADVHHGLANDTIPRLEAFLTACEGRELDFIIQMGDFNHPEREAMPFLDTWTDHRGPRYGVLGNHDMDRGSKERILDWWQVPHRHYSFDAGFAKFIVLDANHLRADGKLIPYESGNWYRSGITVSLVDPEQIEWLRGELAASEKPVVVFIHQAIDEIWSGGSCQNRAEVRRVLEESGKVVAVLQGHEHVDQHEERNGIHYLRVNSASYLWVGEQYGRMAHYRDPLYAFVTLHPDGRMEVEGRTGAWVPPTPAERGYPTAARVTPSIESRRLLSKNLGSLKQA